MRQHPRPEGAVWQELSLQTRPMRRNLPVTRQNTSAKCYAYKQRWTTRVGTRLSTRGTVEIYVKQHHKSNWLPITSNDRNAFFFFCTTKSDQSDIFSEMKSNPTESVSIVSSFENSSSFFFVSNPFFLSCFSTCLVFHGKISCVNWRRISTKQQRLQYQSAKSESWMGLQSSEPF